MPCTIGRRAGSNTGPGRGAGFCPNSNDCSDAQHLWPAELVKDCWAFRAGGATLKAAACWAGSVPEPALAPAAIINWLQYADR